MTDRSFAAEAPNGSGRDTAATVPEILQSLAKAGLISTGAASIEPLPGGISSDVLLVRDGDRRLVVKSALPKLRVKDDWFADVGRSRIEQDYFAHAAGVVPGSVPRVLHADRSAGWFAMEFFGDEWRNWKTALLAGDVATSPAAEAGSVLARLHASSWGNPELQARFDTSANFQVLRIDPYLLATAERVSIVRVHLREEARRLAATRLALVHGDYSPKNLLVAAGRLVVLDAEVAWFGDPAFDAAFLLTHLYLKALHQAGLGRAEAYLNLGQVFWRSYANGLGTYHTPELESRTVRLLSCLMLARIHGKSPVEYLTAPVARDCVTRFALAMLLHPCATFAEFTDAWRHHLSNP